MPTDRKSTRLNSSHLVISYAVFCLEKKKRIRRSPPLHAVRAAPYTRASVHCSAAPNTTGSRSLRSRCPPYPFFLLLFFFFNDTATTEIYTLSLHDALPI